MGSGLHFYSVKENSVNTLKYTKKSIIHMIEFLVDTMFVDNSSNILIGTNCAPYEAVFKQKRVEVTNSLSNA